MSSLNKLVQSLESTLDGYRCQYEEAESIATRNLNMFRTKQQELEYCNEKPKHVQD